MNINKNSETLSTADVIGWSVTSPLIMVYCVFGIAMWGIMGKFSLAFVSMHSKLPQLTILFINLGDPWVGILPLIICCVPLCTMILVKNNKVKIIVPIIAAIIFGIYIRLLIFALSAPFLNELKTLS